MPLNSCLLLKVRVLKSTCWVAQCLMHNVCESPQICNTLSTYFYISYIQRFSQHAMKEWFKEFRKIRNGKIAVEFSLVSAVLYKSLSKSCSLLAYLERSVMRWNAVWRLINLALTQGKPPLVSPSAQATGVPASWHCPTLCSGWLPRMSMCGDNGPWTPRESKPVLSTHIPDRHRAPILGAPILGTLLETRLADDELNLSPQDFRA